MCLCTVSFDLHGSICSFSAHHRAASLVGTHQTYDTHTLLTSAGISWALHICSPCLLSGGLLYVESYPSIWCGRAFWSYSCRGSSVALHDNCRLSKLHRHTSREVWWLCSAHWVWLSVWYLFFPTCCHVISQKPHLHVLFCSWSLH